jgi:Rhodopirellula transposase DDE domain
VIGLRAYQVVTPPAAGGTERPRRSSVPSAAGAATDPTPPVLQWPLDGADGVRMPIGRDEGTAALAVQTLRRWWTLAGLSSYPGARRLLLSPDGGGAKGHCSPWLASALARFAADAELPITVCHLPAGTSRWSRIEHLAWDQFAVDLHGRRAATYLVTLDVIGRSAGGADETGRRSMPAVVRHELNGGWNYTVTPQ